MNIPLLFYRSKLPAYPHQQAALMAMDGAKAFALTMAMRTGKTKVLLDNFGILELDGKVKDLLVIAPAGVYRTWETEIENHISEELRTRLDVHVWDTAKSKNKNAQEPQANFLRSTAPRILLMNVEALSNVARAREFCSSFLRDPLMAMIAIDESTVIKSVKAQRTKFINRKLAPRAMYRRILSGLPTPKSPLDLYSQFEFLDPAILGFKSYYGFGGFMQRYAVTKPTLVGGRMVELIVGYKNVDELQERIKPFCYRVEFRPKIPSTYSRRDVTLTEEQTRLYRELKTFATARLTAESHVTATVVIAQILRLHQLLCGHTRDEQGNLHEVPENKTNQLLEILDDYAGKAVIWCSYDYNIQKLTEALRKRFGHADDCAYQVGETCNCNLPKNIVARFWGGNTATREDEEKVFLNHPDCRFMLATPAAGGRGRTWSVADLVVYFSSTYDLEHRDQSEQRVQGLNKERQVDYIDLIAPGTVEEKILSVLRKKINLATMITGDAWKQWIV